MATVDEHYETLLAGIYVWMLGDPDEAMAKAKAEIEAIGLSSGSGQIADLGAGAGYHSLALADNGYRVHAIDTSSELLATLREQVGDRDITVHECDLLDFANQVDEKLDAVLCMADTVTHLPSRDDVSRLIDAAAGSLTAGGVLCLTFRDYTSPLEGDARFIPVRSDDSRCMTCFLEYEHEFVRVHDLVHERGADGWTFRASSYPKLRLDPDWVAQRMTTAGLSVERQQGLGGMIRLAGSKS